MGAAADRALIAIVVLGPKENENLGRKIAEWLANLRSSEIWSTTKDVMDTPSRILRETGLEEELRQMRDLGRKMDAPFWQSRRAGPRQCAACLRTVMPGKRLHRAAKRPITQLDENRLSRTAADNDYRMQDTPKTFLEHFEECANG